LGVGCVRNLVETALGAVLVTGLGLAALILPCALIDVATGTNLLEPVAVALLLALAAAAILGAVAIYQRRHSDDKKGTADKKRYRRPPR
jgi:membrane protein implicated in regulation of membrane protease activity